MLCKHDTEDIGRMERKSEAEMRAEVKLEAAVRAASGNLQRVQEKPILIEEDEAELMRDPEQTGTKHKVTTRSMASGRTSSAAASSSAQCRVIQKVLKRHSSREARRNLERDSKEVDNEMDVGGEDNKRELVTEEEMARPRALPGLQTSPSGAQVLPGAHGRHRGERPSWMDYLDRKFEGQSSAMRNMFGMMDGRINTLEESLM